jgi:hypothetical protein
LAQLFSVRDAPRNDRERLRDDRNERRRAKDAGAAER